MHVHEVRPRKGKRGVDLISDALPFGRLWYGELNTVSNLLPNCIEILSGPTDKIPSKSSETAAKLQGSRVARLFWTLHALFKSRG
jgi:hypothetical protein